MFTRLTGMLVSRSRVIILYASVLIALTAAWSGTSLGIEGRTTAMRQAVMARDASGGTVVVAIDARSLREVQAWPWPRSFHGKIVEELMHQGARRVVFDVAFTTQAQDKKQDNALSQSLSNTAGRVTLLANNDMNEGAKADALPLATLLMHTTPAAGWISINQNDVISLPRTMSISGRSMGSLSTQLAGLAPGGANYVPDWAVRYSSIPTISAVDVLRDRIAPDAVRGKDVIIGATAQTFGDQWTAADGSRVPGVYIHALGAETLKAGLPVDGGPWVPLALAGVMAMMTLAVSNRIIGTMLLAGAAAAVIGMSWLAREQFHYAVTVAPATIVFITAIIGNLASALAASVMRRLTTDTVTDLPNMTAMEIASPGGTTVAVRLHNHLETASALGREGQVQLMRSIRDRIKLAAGENVIYQVDEHSFAWRTLEDLAETAGAIEGLTALFAAGIPIAGKTINTPISAGIVDDEDDVAKAVPFALLAAEHAAKQGLPWTRHVDAHEEAEWRVTMMGELDAAIRAGDVWVAHQPKWNASDVRCIGSEALVRWTHPERGPIRPDQFIPILEEAGRIEGLTAHVLDCAIRDMAPLDGMSVAVNLSTRLLGRGWVVDRVVETLGRHGMSPDRLTLEITESATLAGDESIRELERLRDLGVSISIDDYGTGQSTLTYVRKLPASELKIDQTFVRSMLTSRSDQLMIDSTIALAHQLGLKVVAEGVETEEEMRMLQTLDCDILQGYHLGRPMALREFVSQVAGDIIERRRRAA